MDDTMEALDDDELEEEADAEVDKILFDLTDGKLGQAGAVGAELPVSDMRRSDARNWDVSDSLDATYPYRCRKRPRRTSIPKPRCNACRRNCTTSSLGSLQRSLVRVICRENGIDCNVNERHHFASGIHQGRPRKSSCTNRDLSR